MRSPPTRSMPRHPGGILPSSTRVDANGPHPLDGLAIVYLVDPYELIIQAYLPAPPAIPNPIEMNRLVALGVSAMSRMIDTAQAISTP